MLLGHDVGTSDGGRYVGYLQGPIWITGEVLDRLELAGSLRELLQGAGLHIHGVNSAFLQRSFQRTEGQIVLVITAQPQLRWILHKWAHHLWLVVPVVRIGEFHDLNVFAGHAVQSKHQLDALFLLNAPPVGLDLVLTPGKPNLLTLQIGHAVDVVARAHQHDAAFAGRMGHAEEPGSADVRLNVNRREETSKRMRLSRL